MPIFNNDVQFNFTKLVKITKRHCMCVHYSITSTNVMRQKNVNKKKKHFDINGIKTFLFAMTNPLSCFQQKERSQQ